MRRFPGSKIQAGEVAQTVRKQRAKSRRFDARVDRLEGRNLMTGGSVVLAGGLVTITPSSTGPNVAIVSYQNVSGTRELDVNLNGVDHYFGLNAVGFVYYRGSSVSGAQTFENETGLHTVAWGGSGANLFASTTGNDEFFGGSGTNTFDAGSGPDMLIGGSGPNVFNESISGSGEILESGSSNTVNVPPNQTGSYFVG
jgi:Ca2+-binding RTX toxin-like protein